ncbi:hypothetical protein QTH91_14490 [Variovorax dokdonensis]|uniref:Orc1-like AAA ATPase domain-containing protein n=1 Tax=Variovorax dokdonensis TaxID=344883 RepID=A0ABT7NCW0_9BURK|nr:hypothetical protein [Variovorax dokdonensis]MDM0045695.1 hypothetical protein [Variovorax dokdonensis]
MGSGLYVGRDAAGAQLRRVLQGQLHHDGRKLVIQSIEGPGGIGKTALFDHVASQLDLRSRRFLTMRIAGSDDASQTTFRAVRYLIDSGKTASPTRKPLRVLFPQVGEVEAAYAHIRRQIVTELPQDGDVSPDVLMSILDSAVSVGKPLNDLFPATKGMLDVSAVEKKIEENRETISRLLGSSVTLAREAVSWWNKLGVGGAAALRNSVRENALVPLAAAFVKDMTAALAGYAAEDAFKPSPSKLLGVDRLLLIVDDYETTQGILGDFLVAHLLPALQAAPFETTVVILGRDQLQATHVSWAQHLGGSLASPLRLDPLARPEMEELLKHFSVTEQSELDRAWADTLGYPFNVHLWLEEVGEGGRTALMLKRFHDRTTRWMTEEQTRWLYHTLFMTEVDKRTLAQSLGDAEEAARANAWFQREGSVRDPHAPVFRVREYLRSRLADYLRVTDPEQYESLLRLSTNTSTA